MCRAIPAVPGADASGCPKLSHMCHKACACQSKAHSVDTSTYIATADLTLLSMGWAIPGRGVDLGYSC